MHGFSLSARDGKRLVGHAEVRRRRHHHDTCGNSYESLPHRGHAGCASKGSLEEVLLGCVVTCRKATPLVSTHELITLPSPHPPTPTLTHARVPEITPAAMADQRTVEHTVVAEKVVEQQREEADLVADEREADEDHVEANAEDSGASSDEEEEEEEEEEEAMSELGERAFAAARGRDYALFVRCLLAGSKDRPVLEDEEHGDLAVSVPLDVDDCEDSRGRTLVHMAAASGSFACAVSLVSP
jgi:hypothetical protein